MVPYSEYPPRVNIACVFAVVLHWACTCNGARVLLRPGALNVCTTSGACLWELQVQLGILHEYAYMPTYVLVHTCSSGSKVGLVAGHRDIYHDSGSKI